MPKYTVPTGLWLAGFLFEFGLLFKKKNQLPSQNNLHTRNQSTITTKVDTIINPAITRHLHFPISYLLLPHLSVLANMIPLLKASLALGETCVVVMLNKYISQHINYSR
jgi:hypothetical protein